MRSKSSHKELFLENGVSGQMKIILKIKEGGQFLPVNKSQIKKDTFASTKVGAILSYLQLGPIRKALIIIRNNSGSFKIPKNLNEAHLSYLCQSEKSGIHDYIF